MQLLTLNRLNPNQQYSAQQISPYFWPNGKLPERADWKELAHNGFRDYRLKLGGLVEHQAEFAISDLQHLGKVEYITMHDCIQGWTGIAKWTGIPMRAIIEHVRP